MTRTQVELMIKGLAADCIERDAVVYAFREYDNQINEDISSWVEKVQDLNRIIDDYREGAKRADDSVNEDCARIRQLEIELAETRLSRFNTLDSSYDPEGYRRILFPRSNSTVTGGIAHTDPMIDWVTGEISVEVFNTIVGMLKDKKKIQAIKAFKDCSGLGLVQCKLTIDRLSTELFPEPLSNEPSSEF